MCFSHSLGGWKVQDQVANRISAWRWRDPFLIASGAFFLCPLHMVKREVNRLHQISVRTSVPIVLLGSPPMSFVETQTFRTSPILVILWNPKRTLRGGCLSFSGEGHQNNIAWTSCYPQSPGYTLLKSCFLLLWHHVFILGQLPKVPKMRCFTHDVNIWMNSERVESTKKLIFFLTWICLK